MKRNKIAFIVIPEKGHVNPYIGPAQALVEYGNEVVFAAPGDISKQLTLAQLKFDSSLIDFHNQLRPVKGKALVELIQDSVALDIWIEELLLNDLSSQVKRIEKFLLAEKIEIVAIDPLYYPAAIAAHNLKLPWCSISNSLNPVINTEMNSPLLNTVERLNNKRLKLFENYGLSPRFSGCDVISPYLTTVFSTKELVGKAPEGIELVGPSLPLWSRGDEVEIKPLPKNTSILYASFGSQIYHWPEIFEKLLAATTELCMHAIFSMGELAASPPWNKTLENLTVYDYAPQQALLEKANVFITHGGANSVMEALACKIPMLISPLCNDQFHQAHFLKLANIAPTIDLRSATVSEIRSTIKSILDSVSNKEIAERVGISYQLNGAKKVADLILEVLRKIEI